MSQRKDQDHSQPQSSETEQHLKDLLNMTQAMAGLGSWQFEKATRQICWSKQMYTILGLELEEAEADFDRLFQLIHHEDRKRVEEQYDSSLAQGKDHDIRYRIILQDNTARYLRDRCRHLVDESGRMTCSVGLLQDVSSLENARSERDKARTEVDSFANIASHDLQEPLRAILGFLQLLEKRSRQQLDDRGRLFVKRSVKAARRMELQLRALLQLARVTSRGQQFAETDLNLLLDGVLERLAPMIKKKNGRINSYRLPVATVDGQQIATLLYNLLHNGLQYNESRNPSIEIEVAEQQQSCRISVKDNGIGIRPEFHSKVLEVFQRLHSTQSYPGIGMGLTICQKIVERHGGSLWVEASGEEGTVFSFTLPVETA